MISRLLQAFVLGALANTALLAAEQPAFDLSRCRVDLDCLWFGRIIATPRGDLSHATSLGQTEVLLTLHHTGLTVVSLESATCNAAVTNAGESLLPTEPYPDGMRAWLTVTLKGSRLRSRHRQTLPFELLLRCPSKPAATIATLTGTLSLVCEIAHGPTFDFAPVSDWIGKSRTVPGCPAGFTIVSLSPLRFTCPPEFLFGPTVATCSLLDVQGKSIAPSDWDNEHRGGDDSGVPYDHVIMPAGGSIHLVLVGQTSSVSVPFTVHDLPLDAPARLEPTHTRGAKVDPAKKGTDF